MKLLELFSGTHSIGIQAEKLNFEVVSLDRDLEAKSKLYNYTSKHHIKEDILTWDYKKDFNPGDFKIITASPACVYWSQLRNCWINRKSKAIHPTDIITKEILEEEINLKGKPMVDKIFEIIEYFKPKYWWIENPQTGKMKDYIKDKYPQYNIFYDVDYCKYSDWGYKKKTRFWTNIEGFIPKICKNDCENIIKIENKKIHKISLGDNNKLISDNGKIIRPNKKHLREKYKDFVDVHRLHFGEKGRKGCVGGGNNRLLRYRIPSKLINELLEKCIFDNQ
tara:strand:- start:22 stop:858 length:837 start_codon:yes stop_codon:yes gene_type:complete